MVQRTVHEDGVSFLGPEKHSPGSQLMIISPLAEEILYETFEEVTKRESPLTGGPKLASDLSFYVVLGGAIFLGRLGPICVYRARSDIEWWQRPIIVIPSYNSPTLMNTILKSSGVEPITTHKKCAKVPDSLTTVSHWAGIKICKVQLEKPMSLSLDEQRWG